MPKVHRTQIRVGCAGWNIPRSAAASFADSGSHLERYARQLNAVEINSSFYRPHRPATYARWATSVPEDFAFSVKMPKQITHELRLINVAQPLKQFMAEAGSLGKQLGCILVQLPPSLVFESSVADAFFKQLRELYNGRVACEPRHASWFSQFAEDLLNDHAITRVAADPSLHADGAEPGGFTDFGYYRLHGSPQIYHSRYSRDFLIALARKFKAISANAEAWCIFDNTAAGHAIDNALEFRSLTGNDSS